MDVVIEYLKNNWIEALGFILALLYIYYMIKARAEMWFVGLVSSAIYIYIFYKSKFYAYMLINVYYFYMSLQGIYEWLLNVKKKDSPLVNMNRKVFIWSMVAIIVLFGILYFVLSEVGSNYPVLDAFSTSIAIVATWLLLKKYIEQWFMWMVSDAAVVIMNLLEQNYLTALLFVIYILLAIYGYRQWLKIKATQTAVETVKI